MKQKIHKLPAFSTMILVVFLLALVPSVVPSVRLQVQEVVSPVMTKVHLELARRFPAIAAIRVMLRGE